MSRLKVLRRMRDEAKPNTPEKMALRWAVETLEAMMSLGEEIKE